MLNVLEKTYTVRDNIGQQMGCKSLVGGYRRITVTRFYTDVAELLTVNASVFLLLGVAFYVTIGVVGLSVDLVPEIQRYKEGVDLTCEGYVPELKSAMDDALEELEAKRKEGSAAYYEKKKAAAQESSKAAASACASIDAELAQFGY